MLYIKSTLMIKNDAFERSVFKNTEEYHNFATEHQVFGAEAIILKKKLDRIYKIPEPNIK